MLCLKPADAQRSLNNKVSVARWMGSANGLLDYYEGRAKKRIAPKKAK